MRKNRPQSAPRKQQEPEELSQISDQEPLDLEGSVEQPDQDSHPLPHPDAANFTVDVSITRDRIAEILAILSDFSKNPAPSMTKVHYFIELRKLYCSLFSYSEELMAYLFSLFGPQETLSFLEAMDQPRPLTIRVNTLKARRATLAENLASRQVNLEPLDFISKTCLKVNSSKVPLGATPEYLSGQYMLQSAASMLPVLALAPQKDEKILDLAAAPGGKTTHIAQLMRNTGIIVANDVSKNRLKALFYNCQRMGAKNVIITNYDGRKFPESLKNFDRVLLDAPCTGLGVISRDPTIKAKRTVLDVKKAGHLQRELLRAAVDRCKVGGYIVYSTCSISFEENEGVVDYVCRKRWVKVIDTGLSLEGKGLTRFGDMAVNERLKKCVRVYPHVHNLDGFFVAKMVKLKDGPKEKDEKDEEEEKKLENSKSKRESNHNSEKKSGKAKNEPQKQQEIQKKEGKSILKKHKKEEENEDEEEEIETTGKRSKSKYEGKEKKAQHEEKTVEPPKQNVKKSKKN